MSIKLSRIKKYWAFIAILLFFLLLCWNWPLYADDAVYKNALEENGNIVNWAKYYFNNWSGRILPNVVLIYLLNLPAICFNIINSIALTLLILYFMKDFIITESVLIKNIVALMIVYIMLVWVNDDLLKGTMFWKSAVVSYIWGLLGALLAIYPFTYHFYDMKFTKLGIKDYLFAFLGATYAANYEQSAVFMLFFMFCLFIFSTLKRGKGSKGDALILLWTIGVTCFCLSAPGNDARYHAEVLGHMQKYDMYSIIDKLIWGACYSLTGLRKYCALPMMFISMFLVINSYLAKKNRQIKVCASFICIYYFVMLISVWSESKVGTGFAMQLFSFISVDSPIFDVTLMQIVASAIGLFAYFLTVLLAITISEELEIHAAALLVTAFGTTVMIGLSPTIYASGSRVMFYLCIILIFAMFRIGYLLYACWKRGLESCN